MKLTAEDLHIASLSDLLLESCILPKQIYFDKPLLEFLGSATRRI